jgi:kynurenine 3-monooxygenase
MALENYVEMRDRVDDADFLLQRELERSSRNATRSASCRAIDGHVPPHSEAQRRGRAQWQILEDLLGPATDLAGIDYAEAERRIHAELVPLA